MPQENFLNLTFDEFTQVLNNLGEKRFRATQIFEWVYQKGVTSFDLMKNLPKDLRAKLTEEFSIINAAQNGQRLVSADGTTKFLFILPDGEKIETVLIPTKTRTTLCLSTQVGCKYGCQFCASGIGGWKRNLTTAEIMAQIITVKSYVRARKLKTLKDITHIVFMGVGEPLDNWTNVKKAIGIIHSPKALNISSRRITISTCGLTPQIKKLCDEKYFVELSVSLHASNQELRKALMPVANKYPLADLIAACREYSRKTKRQVTFEYILIKGLNCGPGAAEELKKLLKGMLAKINLIRYNPVKEFDYEPPSLKEAKEFLKTLQTAGIPATLRVPRGQDIRAACGQLRRSHPEK